MFYSLKTVATLIKSFIKLTPGLLVFPFQATRNDVSLHGKLGVKSPKYYSNIMKRLKKSTIENVTSGNEASH